MAPERRCIACRRSESKQKLLRFVWDGDRVRLDEEQRLEGRGAYLHESLRCWEKMGDDRRWNRAFRLPDRTIARQDLKDLVEEIRQRILPPGEEGKQLTKREKKTGKPQAPGKKIRL